MTNAAGAPLTMTAARIRFATIMSAKRLSLANTTASATVKCAKTIAAELAQPMQTVTATSLSASRGCAFQPRRLLQNAPRTQTARPPRYARTINAALARLIPIAASTSSVGMGHVCQNHLLAGNLALNGRNGEVHHPGAPSSRRHSQNMTPSRSRARSRSTMDEPTAC